MRWPGRTKFSSASVVQGSSCPLSSRRTRLKTVERDEHSTDRLAQPTLFYARSSPSPLSPPLLSLPSRPPRPTATTTTMEGQDIDLDSVIDRLLEGMSSLSRAVVPSPSRNSPSQTRPRHRPPTRPRPTRAPRTSRPLPLPLHHSPNRIEWLPAAATTDLSRAEGQRRAGSGTGECGRSRHPRAPCTRQRSPYPSGRVVLSQSGKEGPTSGPRAERGR